MLLYVIMINYEASVEKWGGQLVQECGSQKVEGKLELSSCRSGDMVAFLASIESCFAAARLNNPGIGMAVAPVC